MDEIEDFSEKIHEQGNEHAHEVLAEGKEKWVLYVALTTAVFAVLAAISGLLAGDHADEAMLAQMRSSDSWAFYQAKSVKAEVLNSSNKILITLGKVPLPETTAKVIEDKKEQAKIMQQAKDEQGDSDRHIARHGKLARAVTLFQIAIAIGAISIITKRKSLWLVSVLFALVAIFFLLAGTVF
ncbi:MAG: DUF4337 family protein [Janthinobacterium lividum]